MKTPSILTLTALVAVLSITACSKKNARTSFFNHITDVGAVKTPGTMHYDEDEDSYRVGGSGSNMWFAVDEFNFVWTKLTGDVSMVADLEFIENGKDSDPHRKGAIMIREDLDTDSKYIDVAVHGDGLTSLQFRKEKGDITHEVQTHVSAPGRIKIDKIGNWVYMSVAAAGEEFQPTGSFARITFGAEFYIGLAVTSHNNDLFEEVKFTNVQFLDPSDSISEYSSSLEIISTASGDRRSVYTSRGHITDVRWASDGDAVFFSENDTFYKLSISANSQPELVKLGANPFIQETRTTADDGREMNLSIGSSTTSLNIIPIDGGDTRELAHYYGGAKTISSASWSPDDSYIAYVKYQPAGAED